MATEHLEQRIAMSARKGVEIFEAGRKHLQPAQLDRAEEIVAELHGRLSACTDPTERKELEKQYASAMTIFENACHTFAEFHLLRPKNLQLKLKYNIQPAG